MTNVPDFLDGAHEHAFGNRPEIAASDFCGCFSCLAVFPATEVWEWIRQLSDEADTGFCPYCMLDTVLGDSSNLPVRDQAFLRAMNERFFRGPPLHDQTADPRPASRAGDWKRVAGSWILERQNRTAKHDAQN
jgi:hypothetical protein